jgi:hypothetical protein
MSLNFDHESFPPTGFESIVKRRAVMQQWSVLTHLSHLRKNQEAAEIVASFQRQLDAESSASTWFTDKVA